MWLLHSSERIAVVFTEATVVMVVVEVFEKCDTTFHVDTIGWLDVVTAIMYEELENLPR